MPANLQMGDEKKHLAGQAPAGAKAGHITPQHKLRQLLNALRRVEGLQPILADQLLQLLADGVQVEPGGTGGTWCRPCTTQAKISDTASMISRRRGFLRLAGRQQPT